MLPENYTRLDNYRYERKFTGTEDVINRTEVMVKTHPEAFSERYQPRRVNNIYFDTPTLEYFADNIQGKAERIKYRIRWYGNVWGEVSPILELKIKKGLVGYKKSYPLKNFTVNENLTKEDLIESICHSNVPDDITEKIKILEPVLLNSYERRYFESFNRKFRLTFDTKVSYYHFNRTIQFGKPVNDFSSFILEMKYDQEHDKQAERITQIFPFRLSKSSKYINGILHFYPGIAI